jgi:endonuclease/exonuclease/phosphatase family metal-dependent hydrolase
VLRQYSIEEKHILLGDFNLHHLYWDEYNIRNTHDKADALLVIIEEYQIQLLLPPGTLTRQKRDQTTTIDLVFATHMLSYGVITYGLADYSLDHDSDHLAVSTIIEAVTIVE